MSAQNITKIWRWLAFCLSYKLNYFLSIYRERSLSRAYFESRRGWLRRYCSHVTAVYPGYAVTSWLLTRWLKSDPVLTSSRQEWSLFVKEAFLGVTYHVTFVQSMLITDAPIKTTFNTTSFGGKLRFRPKHIVLNVMNKWRYNHL